MLPLPPRHNCHYWQLSVYQAACGPAIYASTPLNRSVGGIGGYAEGTKTHEHRISTRLQGRLVPFRVMAFPLVESMYSTHEGCWPTPSKSLSGKSMCVRMNATYYC